MFHLHDQKLQEVISAQTLHFKVLATLSTLNYYVFLSICELK
jgi:hypothetical protein